MTEDATKVLEAALMLPVNERASIAGMLLESLDETVDEKVEQAWSKEIARRIQEIDEGKVITVPWSVAREQIMGGK